LCNPLFVEYKAKVFFKSFKIKVFFKLSEKQPVVLSKQPIVLLLGVFKNVENCFGWLICCQTKTIDCLFRDFQSIVCLKILTKFCFVG